MNNQHLETMKNQLEDRINKIETQLQEATDKAPQDWLDNMNTRLGELRAEYENLRADMSEDSFKSLTHRVNAIINEWNAEFNKLVSNMTS